LTIKLHQLAYPVRWEHSGNVWHGHVLSAWLWRTESVVQSEILAEKQASQKQPRKLHLMLLGWQEMDARTTVTNTSVELVMADRSSNDSRLQCQWGVLHCALSADVAAQLYTPPI
jgi:hypothetical protein